MRRMATESFSRPMTIRSDRQAEALIAAYEASLDQKHIERIDIREELKRGEELIKKYFAVKKVPETSEQAWEPACSREPIEELNYFPGT